MPKKILYFVLTVAVIFTVFPAIHVQTADYIEIYTFEDLEGIADNPTGNYLLMADIDMGQGQWHPTEFGGVLDGNGHTLYNLQLNNLSSQSYTTVDWHHNEYDTYFAALFSKCENASIMNLNLINVNADITTDEHCFAAGIAGIALNTEITNCHVTARIRLTTTNRMIGIGGIAGFGEGIVLDSSVELTAIIIDNNPAQDTEEFIGGIWATGYPTVENCDVVLDSYATTFSYAHDGGIVGMHRVYIPNLAAYRHISGCSVDTTLNYFDHSIHGHRHFGAVAGEKINRYLEIFDNTVINFTQNKYDDYSLILEPCMCSSKEYYTETVPFTCTEFGYTIYTCAQCGYSYTDDYTAPSHRQGEWETASEPTYETEGLMQSFCTECGELLSEQAIPKLKYAEQCALSDDALTMAYKSTEKLSAQIFPDDAYYQNVIWSSSDESVAKADSEGNIYAAGKGTAQITCTSADGAAQSQCEVNVKYTFTQWLIIIFLFGWVWY